MLRTMSTYQDYVREVHPFPPIGQTQWEAEQNPRQRFEARATPIVCQNTGYYGVAMKRSTPSEATTEIKTDRLCALLDLATTVRESLQAKARRTKALNRATNPAVLVGPKQCQAITAKTHNRAPLCVAPLCRKPAYLND